MKLQLTACHVYRKKMNVFHGIRPNVVCKLSVSLELGKCSSENSTNRSVAACVACHIDVVQTLPELHITAGTIFVLPNTTYVYFNCVLYYVCATCFGLFLDHHQACQ